MFFSIIGVGLVVYGCFYTLAMAIFDCDVQLGLLEVFGKSPSKSGSLYKKRVKIQTLSVFGRQLQMLERL